MAKYKLSHYTDLNGLNGILSSQSIWATNFLDAKDPSEFFYAWRIMTEEALHIVMANTPEDVKEPNANVPEQATKITKQFREALMASTEDYGHMYTTSFARASTDDQEKRGLLTLWERYPGHSGYCLQFDENDVHRIVELDASRSSYEYCAVAKVNYGVDKNDFNFKELCQQLAYSLLIDLAAQRRDARLYPKHETWAKGYLLQRIMAFCATHKDPCFVDEREERIIVFPSNQTVSRVFTGLAIKKKIYRTDGGRRYLAIGEIWRPGLIPRRIIVGSKASIPPNAGTIEIGHAEMPVT